MTTQQDAPVKPGDRFERIRDGWNLTKGCAYEVTRVVNGNAYWRNDVGKEDHYSVGGLINNSYYWRRLPPQPVKEPAVKVGSRWRANAASFAPGEIITIKEPWIMNGIDKGWTDTNDRHRYHSRFIAGHAECLYDPIDGAPSAAPVAAVPKARCGGHPDHLQCWLCAPKPAAAPTVAERPRQKWLNCEDCVRSNAPGIALRHISSDDNPHWLCDPCYVFRERDIEARTLHAPVSTSDRSWLETTRHVPESLCGSLRWRRR